jgi:hypothetical protein
LIDAETYAIQTQLEVSAAAVVSTLDKDGHAGVYKTWTTPADRDLPSPISLLGNKRIAYMYGMMRYYRRQFDLAWQYHAVGCWPLINYDLCAPLDGKRVLLVQALPMAVTDHASLVYLQSSTREQVRNMRALFDQVAADANLRLSQLSKRRRPSRLLVSYPFSQEGNGQVDENKTEETLKKIMDYIYEAQRELTVWDLYLAERDRRREEREQREREIERQSRERAEHDFRERFGEPNQIPDGSGQMDRFEHNRDGIGGMC